MTTHRVGTVARLLPLLVAAALAVPGTPRTALGRTVEEVLKEKGVITEAESREASASRLPVYVPGKGFTFTSADRNFQLSLGGRGQFQYQYLDREIGQDASQWRIRRFKVYLGGFAFSEDLTYRVQVDLAKSGTPQMLDDAWINYRIVDEAQAQAGQFKVPFLRQELVSDGALQFVDRANVVDAFKPSYDMGAMGWGKAAKGRFAYAAGIFGGTGQGQPRTGTNNAFAARAVVNPFGEVPYTESDLEADGSPRFSLGADIFANTLKKSGRTSFQDTTSGTPPYAGTAGWLGQRAAAFDNTERVDIRMGSADAAFKWRGLSAQGEYMRGTGDGRGTGRKVSADGAYVQAGYFLVPKRLEVAARWTRYDPDTDVPENTQVQIQGAVSYYFRGHDLKIQGDYTDSRAEQGAGKPATDDKLARVQAQLAF